MRMERRLNLTILHNHLPPHSFLVSPNSKGVAAAETAASTTKDLVVTNNVVSLTFSASTGRLVRTLRGPA